MQLSNRQKNGIVCLVIALVLFGVAINNTFINPKISVSNPSGLGVSRMIGAFLPGILVAVTGFWFLFNPPKNSTKK